MNDQEAVKSRFYSLPVENDYTNDLLYHYPYDILVEILNHLNIRHIAALSRTCRGLRQKTRLCIRKISFDHCYSRDSGTTIQNLNNWLKHYDNNGNVVSYCPWITSIQNMYRGDLVDIAEQPIYKNISYILLNNDFKDISKFDKFIKLLNDTIVRYTDAKVLIMTKDGGIIFKYDKGDINLDFFTYCSATLNVINCEFKEARIFNDRHKSILNLLISAVSVDYGTLLQYGDQLDEYYKDHSQEFILDTLRCQSLDDTIITAIFRHGCFSFHEMTFLVKLSVLKDTRRIYGRSMFIKIVSIRNTLTVQQITPVLIDVLRLLLDFDITIRLHVDGIFKLFIQNPNKMNITYDNIQLYSFVQLVSTSPNIILL